MPDKTTAEKDSKTVETVKKLLSLAQDDAASEEERRTTALKAIQLMKDNELQVVSSAQLAAIDSAVAQARQLAEEAKAEGRKSMVMGALGGMLLSKYVKF